MSEDELTQIFVEEASDILQVLREIVKKWSENLSQMSVVNDMQRELHTLKGGARMVKQNNISNIAHALESLFEKIIQKKISPTTVHYTLANNVFNELMIMIECLKNRKPILVNNELLQQLANYVEVPSSNNTHSLSAVPETAEIAEHKDKEEKSKKITMIRVKAPLLEKINDLLNESGIATVHMGQQFTVIEQQLHDMEQIINKLSESTRNLQLQIESRQTNSRVVKKSGNEFDDLEMDRYSQNHSMVRVMTEGVNDAQLAMEIVLLNQSRLANTLQNNILETRIISFSSVVPRLTQVVRSVADTLHKKINFDISQAEGEIDRVILDNMVPGIEHILRNAIDHGIEDELIRVKAGKSSVGNIQLVLSREGSDLLLEISDDGAGINIEAVRKKALSLNLISATKKIAVEELLQCILQPGFTTRQVVSEISGRGIGMDVVNTEIKKLGGSISIASVENQGTKITIKIPFTLSLNRALFFSVHQNTYGLQISNIAAIARIPYADIESYAAGNKITYDYNGKMYKIIYLGELLNVPFQIHDFKGKKNIPLILLRTSNFEVGLLVNTLIGTREIVMQGLGRQFEYVDVFSGATITSEGYVILVLDALALAMRSKIKLNQEFNTPLANETSQFSETGNNLHNKLIMVVDDSITVRKVTTHFLERNHYEVISAKDGVDALELLNQKIPDLIILDIEMPRMDGFDFTIAVRNDSNFKKIPIIMISSRAGRKHLDKAFQLGVDFFISKPYEESHLLAKISELLEKKNAR